MLHIEKDERHAQMMVYLSPTHQMALTTLIFFFPLWFCHLKKREACIRPWLSKPFTEANPPQDVQVIMGNYVWRMDTQGEPSV